MAGRCLVLSCACLFIKTISHYRNIQAVTFGQVLKTIVSVFAIRFFAYCCIWSLIISSFTSVNFDGEVSTDDVFTHDDVTLDDDLEFAKHLNFEIFTFIFWCVSVLFITIVLTNLMISLAVGDIQRVYSKADLQRLKVQINYILEVNELNSARKLCRTNRKSSCVFVYDEISETYELHQYNCWEKIKKILIVFIWGCKRFDSEKEIYPLHSRQAKGKCTEELKSE